MMLNAPLRWGVDDSVVERDACWFRGDGMRAGYWDGMGGSGRRPELLVNGCSARGLKLSSGGEDMAELEAGLCWEREESKDSGLYRVANICCGAVMFRISEPESPHCSRHHCAVQACSAGCRRNVVNITRVLGKLTRNIICYDRLP